MFVCQTGSARNQLTAAVLQPPPKAAFRSSLPKTALYKVLLLQHKYRITLVPVISFKLGGNNHATAVVTAVTYVSSPMRSACLKCGPKAAFLQ
jgi:hypothetical protein